MRDRLTKAVMFAACLCLCAHPFYRTIQAQNRVVRSVRATSPSGDWQRDKLKGHVRRIRVETAKILLKEGKPIESPRVLRELSSYGPNGIKINSVAYPAQGGGLVGKPEYQYDSNGNIVEMILHGADASILSREVYQYEFDEFQNWKKMTRFTTVYENGNIGYEPVEVTYRTITYYYVAPVSKVATATAEPAAPIMNPAPAAPKVTVGPTGSSAPGVSVNPDNVSPTKPARASTEVGAANVAIPKSTSEQKTTAQLGAAASSASESSGQRAYTPGLGSSERKAILSALRASVGQDLQKPMIFRVGTLTAKNGLAELSVTPLQPNLQPFDYHNTPYEKCMAAGDCTVPLKVVLRKQNSTWTVVKYAFGSRGVTTTRNADQLKSEKSGAKESPLAVTPRSISESEKRTADQAKSEKAAKVTPETKSPQPTAPVATQAVTTPADPSNPAVITVSEEALRNAAIELPQPDYPQAAISSQAEGNVEVQILINEKGEVLNARAVSGDPELGAAAEAAARRARFMEAKLSTEPARIYGVINYTFIIPPDQKSASAPAASDVSSEPMTAKPEEITAPASVKKEEGSDPKPPAVSLSAPSPLYTQGLSFLASHRYAEAVEALKQAIQLNPNDANAYFKLGLAHSGLSQPEEAVVALNTGIRIKPELADAETYYYLGNAYTALGKHSEALESLKQAMRLMKAVKGNSQTANVPTSPSYPALHYVTGLAYYNLRRYKNAVDELKQVIALNPKLAQAYYGLALSYIGLGDLKSAEKQRKALASLDPVLAEKLVPFFSTPSQ
jgi:TonB family protein